MAYLNKIQLIGYVGKNPEVRTFEGGNKVVNFTVATTKRYTDRYGAAQELTMWHNIQVGGKAADVAEKYVKSGDPLYVEGELISRSYTDKDNQTRTIYEVRASQIQLLRQKDAAKEAPAQATIFPGGYDDMPC